MVAACCWRLQQLTKADATEPPLTLVLPVAGQTSYLVGRKEGAVVLANDKSISRKHAELSIVEGALQVKDLESKFGTFINEKRLDATAHVLAHGVKLKLGTTTFAVECVPLVLCASGISGDAKAKLKATCDKVGALLVKDWRDGVSHLITAQMQWTPKFLYALGALVPVVSPAWLDALAARTTPAEASPDVRDVQYAPSPPPGRADGGVDARTGMVNEVRASLFCDVRLMCLPPTAAHC